MPVDVDLDDIYLCKWCTLQMISKWNLLKTVPNFVKREHGAYSAESNMLVYAKYIMQMRHTKIGIQTIS